MELSPGITIITYMYMYMYILNKCIYLCLRITNSPIADVFVVWGKCAEDGKIRGFILEKVTQQQNLSTDWVFS